MEGWMNNIMLKTPPFAVPALMPAPKVSQDGDATPERPKTSDKSGKPAPTLKAAVRVRIPFKKAAANENDDAVSKKSRASARSKKSGEGDGEEGP